MNGVGRTPVLTEEQLRAEREQLQSKKDRKRETRKSLMKVVAHATDVDVKRAPVAWKGQLPQTEWDYHERIPTGRRRQIVPLPQPGKTQSCDNKE